MFHGIKGYITSFLYSTINRKLTEDVVYLFDCETENVYYRYAVKIDILPIQELPPGILDKET